MADEQPVIATAPIETAAPQPTESAPEQSNVTPETASTETSESPTADEVDWDALFAKAPTDKLLGALDRVDADALRNSRRIMGISGEMAKRQAVKEAEVLAERLADQKLAERGAKAEQERLAKLLKDDPYAYRDEVERREQQEQEASKSVAELATFAGTVSQAVTNLLPEAVKAKYLGKVYPGNYREGLVTFLNEAVPDLIADGISQREASLRAELDAEYKKREPAMREALRREILAERNGSVPTPDLGSGTPAVNEGLTPERYNTMSYAERQKLKRENPRAIDAMVAAATRG